MADMLSQIRFDGMALDYFGGRFTGTFDVEPNEAADIKLDSEVYFVVRARVTGAAIGETKSGDLKRINVYTVTDAVSIPTDVGWKLATGAQAQLAFDGALLSGLDDDEPEPIAAAVDDVAGLSDV